MVAFVKLLTVRAWCVSLWPYLFQARLRSRAPINYCYVFEGSRIAMAIARLSARPLSVIVEPLRFQLMDVRDEHGILIRLRVVYDDLVEVQAEMMEEPAFREAITLNPARDRLPIYLAKALTPTGFLEYGALWRVLLVIQICAWHLKRDVRPGTPAVLFLERRPWADAIARYAARQGMTVMLVPGPWSPRVWLRRHVSLELRAWLRDVRTRWHPGRLHVWLTRKAPAQERPVGPSIERGHPERHPPPIDVSRKRVEHRRTPRIAVDYNGHFNLTHPERYSDLFFWQQSSLPGRNLIVCFKSPQDPLNEEKWAQLSEHDIEAVALQPAAVSVPAASGVTYRPRIRIGRRQAPERSGIQWTLEAAWLHDQRAIYRALRDYWTDLFATYGITIYVTWFKYDRDHCAMADALQALGGITAMYQRAYESHPSPHLTVATDIFFGFSPAGAAVEQQSGSVIPYHVATGYLGDHRFPLLRVHAERLRETLHGYGATRILAFTDENSTTNSRWYHSHELMRRDYTFLLEKVLNEPWLGLVVKPKVPSTLRQRLGPVAELLRWAEATGRCFVYEGGVLHSSFPPAAAALVADVMIHGHLFAATAGLESALAGVPTLLVDHEGWSVSPLYRLGVGRVVFTDWDALWKTCVDHWTHPGGVPGFGDWSSMLEELDPFRDGRAAQRMGTYLQWLLEGFKASLRRETVMADAAERYAALWGKDKITHVNVEVPQPYPGRDTSPYPMDLSNLRLTGVAQQGKC